MNSPAADELPQPGLESTASVPPALPPPASVVAGPQAEPEFDLGVLFIHGIGRQQAGETLVRFGEPIIKWIGRWCSGAAMSKAASNDVVRDALPAALIADEFASVRESRVSGGEDQTSSFAEVQIAIPDLSAGRDPSNMHASTAARWLFVESRWAERFIPPTFFEVALWGFVVYPWLNSAHFGARIRRIWQRWLSRTKPWRAATFPQDALFTLVYLVGSVFVAILVLFLTALLLVLAMPPIPAVRRFAAWVQNVLAGSLGDSYVLVCSPIQRVAIVSQVLRDLEQMIPRCRRLAIVAHSQGASVAVLALGRKVLAGRPAGANLLITVGSGVRKLTEIGRIAESSKWRMGWLPIVGLLMMILGLELGGIVDVLPFVGTWPFGMVLVALGMFFWLGGAVSTSRRGELSPEDFEPATWWGTPVAWRDYYASEDPIPNGPLFDSDPKYMTSIEVYNAAAAWSDHTSYFKNMDGFVGQLARDLAVHSGLKLVPLLPGDSGRFRIALARRRSRVCWLAAARILTCLLLPVVIFMRWHDLEAIGKWGFDKAAPLDSAAAWLAGDAWRPSQLSTDGPASMTTGGLLLVAAGLLGFQLVRLVWVIWTVNDTRHLLRRSTPPNDEGPAWFCCGVLALTNAGIFVAAGEWNVEALLTAIVGAAGLWTIPIGVARFGPWRTRHPARTFFADYVLFGLLFAPIMLIYQSAGWSDPARLGLLGTAVIACGVLAWVDPLRFLSIPYKQRCATTRRGYARRSTPDRIGQTL